jgi:hypothetical protein
MPMWTFPALIQPSVFVAAPGDLAYLREAVARELEDLQRKVADDHGIRLYDWQVDKAEDGFRDWVPPQGQIPLPSDPQCRAVICMLGERIGTPLTTDFDTRPLGPIQALRGDGVGLVHPWEPGAEDAGGFALTGTVFEYLAALQANRERGHDEGGAERGQPPVLLLVVGDETVREDLDPLDANWGGHRLFEAAERRFRDSHGARWRTASREWEQTQYVPQVTQLRNFVRYLEGRGIFPRIAADEEQARAELRAFLIRELDLRVREQARNPFKGLQAFDREDNGVFVGREAERTQAVAELTALWNDAAHPTFYGVIGGSGGQVLAGARRHRRPSVPPDLAGQLPGLHRSPRRAAAGSAAQALCVRSRAGTGAAGRRCGRGCAGLREGARLARRGPRRDGGRRGRAAAGRGARGPRRAVAADPGLRPVRGAAGPPRRHRRRCCLGAGGRLHRARGGAPGDGRGLHAADQPRGADRPGP